MIARRDGLWLLLLCAPLVSIGGALFAGEITASLPDVIAAVLGDQHSAAIEVVRQLRLPRALAAFACGGLLALSGVLMQVLLRNPLADPYVLGISGGAGVGALLAMLFGGSLLVLHASAFGGAALVMLLVLALSHGPGGWTDTRMVLTGVIVGSGCAALIALVLSISPAAQLPGMLFWLMGDASGAAQPALPLGLLVLATLVIWPFSRELNLLARGALAAQSLGVPVVRLRLALYLLASLLTAVALTAVGAVGFIGLVVPHALRLAIGGDHRQLLPASAIAGGSFLTLADTLARTLLSPIQLPVGVLMALIGVPAFLLLLTRQARAS